MRGTFRIFTIHGIPIRIHYSFLLVLPFLALLFGRVFAAAARHAEVPPALLHGSPWLWGLGVAIGLFAAVLIHELAHALYALSKGIPVRDITLLMIGGVSQITEQPKRSRDEAIMALVGPITSLVLGAGFYLLFLLVRDVAYFDLRFALFYLSQLNLALGIFNLIPAFPMDGGRVLRAALVPRLGMLRATRAAAVAGKTFAILFGILGLFSFNLLLILVALFVYFGAEGESQQALVRTTLGHIKVRDLMAARTTAVDAHSSVSSTADTMIRERRLALPVTDSAKGFGVVTLEDVRRVPLERQEAMSTGQVAHRVSAVAPDDEVWKAVRIMDTEGLPQLPVVEQGQLVGTIAHGDVARGIRLHELALATARRAAVGASLRRGETPA